MRVTIYCNDGDTLEMENIQGVVWLTIINNDKKLTEISIDQGVFDMAIYSYHASQNYKQGNI